LAGVTLVDPGRLGPGVYFVDRYANTANTVTFGQGIISHQVAGEWWRYAAWYGPDRRVRVGRQPSGGGWEIVVLPMSLQRNDSHNCISLGISAADGRLHVCAGAHGAAMAYTRTVAGAVDDVPAWRATLFATPTDTLAGVAIGNMTYPVFTGKPDGGLLFWYRNGGPSNGRARLAEYDGTWRLLGDVTRSTGTWTAWNGATSTSRYLYSPAPQYDGTRLHLVGTWRESNPAVLCAPNTIANHHVVHVYSDDHGRTWRNGAGTQVAATGVDPLSVNDPGILADSNTDTRYALQVPSLAVGPAGLIGYLGNYVRGGLLPDGCVNNEAERIQKAGEHARWRDAQGWHNSSVVVAGQNVFCQYPSGRAGRGHIVFGSNGDMHVLYSGLRIYSATPPDYNDWSLTFNGPAYLNAFGEFQIDRTRQDHVSVLYCERSTGNTSPVWVREFVLGP
jgi:hypothetical protein